MIIGFSVNDIRHYEDDLAAVPAPERLLSMVEVPFVKAKAKEQIRAHEKIKALNLSVNSIHMQKDFFQVYKTKEEMQENIDYIKLLHLLLHTRTLVFHPYEDTDKDVLDFLFSNLSNITICFENTDKSFFPIMDYCQKYHNAAMVMDISHMFFQKLTFYDYEKYKISHFHVRGYDKSVRYVRFHRNDKYIHNMALYYKSKIKDIPLILEYPYVSFMDIMDDCTALCEIIGRYT